MAGFLNFEHTNETQHVPVRLSAKGLVLYIPRVYRQDVSAPGRHCRGRSPESDGAHEADSA